MFYLLKNRLVFAFIIVAVSSCQQGKSKNEKKQIVSITAKKSEVVPIDNSATTDSLEYRKALLSFLTNPSVLPDSLIKPIDTAGIPGLDLEKYSGKSKSKKKKTKVNFKNGIFLIAKTGKGLTFKNVKAARKKPGKQFRFCAYDNLYNTLYMAEVRKDSNFTVFGVCLNTGDIFDLWVNDTLTNVEKQYTYAFSPNYRWLLKTAVNDGFYSCHLLDVSTGNEMTFIENSATKYSHFVIKPQWNSNSDFSFVEVNLEYDGVVYDKDYSAYLAALKKKNFDTFKLKNLPLKGTKYEYRIKPGYTSTELLKKSQVDL